VSSIASRGIAPPSHVLAPSFHDEVAVVRCASAQIAHASALVRVLGSPGGAAVQPDPESTKPGKHTQSLLASSQRSFAPHVIVAHPPVGV
jgi:hypothetical protein